MRKVTINGREHNAPGLNEIRAAFYSQSKRDALRATYNTLPDGYWRKLFEGK